MRASFVFHSIYKQDASRQIVSVKQNVLNFFAYELSSTESLSRARADDNQNESTVRYFVLSLCYIFLTQLSSSRLKTEYS